jgi:predicted aconitase
MNVDLTKADHALLDGEGTQADRLAMTVIVRLAEAMGAPRLLDVTSAHIDSCLYHGRAGLDFALRMADGGGRVKIPTTLNVTSLDLLHPDMYVGEEETADLAKELMEAYERMGCSPTWTCAPYQLATRPAFGEQIAWAESNAIVFANSVLGARTHRYGDFVDICAAVTGRVPAAGLHLEENRKGQVLFRMKGIPPSLMETDVLYPVLGHLVGEASGIRIPVIEGLPPAVTEDRLKAMGAGAASSGAVGLMHVVGSTPEAPTVGDAFGGASPPEVIDVTPKALAAARDDLSTLRRGELSAVCLGTPHYSREEIEGVAELLDGERVDPSIELYVSTGRGVAARVPTDRLAAIEASGARIVVDTCTYITPIIRNRSGAVMTDSAKWAFYAPSNLGVDVVFGGIEECVASAIAGKVVRDPEPWAGV